MLFIAKIVVIRYLFLELYFQKLNYKLIEMEIIFFTPIGYPFHSLLIRIS